VRVLTLEQLDEAFQKGLVNERTRVFQDGMDEPAFLGELLGLGEDDESHEEPVVAAPPPNPASKRVHQNTLVGLWAEPPRTAAPQSRAVPPGQPAWAPPTSKSGVRTVQSAPPPMSVVPRSQGPAPVAAHHRPQSGPPPFQTHRPPAPESAWPPVITRASAQSSVPPHANPAPTTGVVAPSVVPMAMDLGADDFDYPRPRRTGKVLLAGFAVLAVAAGAGLVVTGKGQALVSSITASAAAPAPTMEKPKPVVDTQSHAYDPGDTPVKLHDSPPPVVLTTRENETQQLAAAGMTAGQAAEAAGASDKQSPQTKPSKMLAVSNKHAKSSAGASFRKSMGGSGGGAAPKGPFKSGGDTHDPLNGSL